MTQITIEKIIILKRLLLFLLPLLFFFVLMEIHWREGTMKAGKAGVDFAGRILKKSRLNYLNYHSIQRFLNAKGAVYLFGEMATPVIYLLVKLCTGALLFLMGASQGGILPGIAGGAVGFLVPDLLLELSNSVDNDAMLSDIKCIYDTLRSQTKAGVFLSASLGECYLAVKNRRLKSALLELTNDISTRRDVEEALERFNEKFDCNQIDIFCIVILQSLQSGRSVKVLEDLSQQMNDLQHAINLKEREALERKVQIIELLIFVGLLGITVYSLGIEVLSSLTEF